MAGKSKTINIDGEKEVEESLAVECDEDLEYQKTNARFGTLDLGFDHRTRSVWMAKKYSRQYRSHRGFRQMVGYSICLSYSSYRVRVREEKRKTSGSDSVHVRHVVISGSTALVCPRRSRRLVVYLVHACLDSEREP